MENIPADRQLFQKLRIGHLCNIGIAVVLFVTGGVVIHRLFQCGGDSHIVNDKPALFISENTIDTSDSLHQIVAMHRLVYIHRCKGRNIKSCQPHIHDNGNFQRAVVVLELFCQLVLMALVADDRPPFFRVFVAFRHYDSNLLRPGGAHL